MCCKECIHIKYHEGWIRKVFCKSVKTSLGLTTPWFDKIVFLRYWVSESYWDSEGYKIFNLHWLSYYYYFATDQKIF